MELLKKLTRKSDRLNNPSKLPVVKKVELPVKDIVPIEELRQNAIESATITAESLEYDNATPSVENEPYEECIPHDDSLFCMYCSCRKCIDYREVILQLMEEHLKTKSIWNTFKKTVKMFYKPVIDSMPPNYQKMYEKLSEDKELYWMVNGVMNQSKLDYVDFIFDFSFTANIYFGLFNTLLLVEDAHQLFELMTLQVECVTRAYARGLLEVLIAAKESLPSEIIIRYVLIGYQILLDAANDMASFLFSFENSHLEQFSLSWVTINKRLYQKWVFTAFAEPMKACITKLKNEVSPERYASIVREYVKLDDEMMLVNKQWRTSWKKLNNYHMSEQDRERRMRIRKISNIFENMRTDQQMLFTEPVNIPQWETHSNRKIVWQSMVQYVKDRWPKPSKTRLNATVYEEQCAKCSSAVEFHNFYCQCVTCLIMGSPSSPNGNKTESAYCFECTISEKSENDKCLSELLQKHSKKEIINPELLKLTESDIKEMIFDDISALFGIKCNTLENSGSYHISWAVFKHLKDRQKYPHSTIEEKYFCSRYFCTKCPNLPCRLAIKILKDEICYSLAKQLINYYQPFSFSDNEMDEMLINITIYVNKVILMNLPAYQMPNDDITVKTLWIFFISMMGSCYCTFDKDSPSDEEPIESYLKNLKLIDGDIVLSMERLENAQKPNTFCDFVEKMKDMISKKTGHFKDLMKLSNAEEPLQLLTKLFNEEEALEYFMLLWKTEKNHIEEQQEYEYKNTVKHDEYLFQNKLQEIMSELGKDDVKLGVDTDISPQDAVDEFTTKYVPKSECCSNTSCPDNNFGKMCFHEFQEYSHARMNETRDRLRKKLNELTNSKKLKTNNKNIPLKHIKQLNDSSNGNSGANLANVINDSAKLQNKINTREVANNKELASQIESSKDNSKTIESKENNLKIPENNDRVLDDSKNLDAWVKNTLSFIEGSKEVKKTKSSTDSKKAAKKAKQKQKREEQKRIEELQPLRSQFLDLYSKEFVAKNDLKTHKLAKKRDKKRIMDLENSIKKLSRAKARVETSILELIGLVKSTNSEFKFSYLPTKEQQQEFLQRAEKSKNVDVKSKTEPTKKQELPLPAQLKMSSLIEGQQPATTQSPQLHAQSLYNLPPQLGSSIPVPDIRLHNALLTPNTQVSDDNNADSSKRMVTIRRVNLPHVYEPQVTVTAKGASPDKDKLLYTFINGQLVPAASLDSQILSVLQPSIFPDLSHMQLSYRDQQQTSNIGKETANNASPIAAAEKTKTQLKKERKRAKKLALAAAEEERNKKLEQKAAREVGQSLKKSKQNKKSSAADVDEPKPVRKETSTKAMEKTNNGRPAAEKIIERQSTPPVPAQKSYRSNGTSTSTPKDNGNGNETDANKQTKKKSNKKTDDNAVLKNNKTDQKNSVEISERKHPKLIDNGQFDNNQFNMLHLDELSLESSSVKSDKPVKKKTVKNNVSNNSNNNNNNNKKNNNNNISNNKKENTNTENAKHQVRQNQQQQQDPKQPQQLHRQKKIKSCDINCDEKVSRRDKSNTVSLTENLEKQMPSDRRSSVDVAKSSTKKSSRKNSLQSQSTSCKTASTVATPNIEKTVLTAENMAKSLHHSMQKLNLNADTTIELVKDVSQEPSAMMHLNVSIMEQLNRGVQVEDLTLPPGITLTKVDANKAEALRAKRESIGKLSQPIQSPQPAHNQMEMPVIPTPLLPHLGKFGHDQASGVIMVDAMASRQKSEPMTPSSLDSSTSSKKGKRRNKKKKSSGLTNSEQEKGGQAKNTNEPKMITLRNPMFHVPGVVGESAPVAASVIGGPMHNQVPLNGRYPVAPLPMDQPAAIIKNENGMFTIRNPVLHQAFSNGLQNNYRQYVQPQDIFPSPGNNSFSYFSDNTHPSGVDFNTNSSSTNKNLSAIGSEMKNAQQHKKMNSHWNANSGSTTGHENCAPTAHGSCDYLGMMNCSLQQKYQQSNYYNGGQNSFDTFGQSLPNCGNLFDNNTHNCDDSPPPSIGSGGFNHYLEGIVNPTNKHDDNSYFRNLIPGQNLNSEVTIHNITESKFGCNHGSPISHGVEITPITCPSRRSDEFNTQQRNHIGGMTDDCLFTPNQILNLKELQSTDFGYNYNSAKDQLNTNIHVNNEYLGSTNNTPDSRSSPYLDDTLDGLVRNMNTLKLGNGNQSPACGNDVTTTTNNWW